MSGYEAAYFAAGCFWGVQYYFDQIPGVAQTEVGYTGGNSEKPTYETVCSQTTGHAEAVKVVYDPKKVSYETLLRHFFRMHDPTQINRQGPDIGSSYRSAVFYVDESQKIVAGTVIKQLNNEKFSGKIATELKKLYKWWPAEDYHQKYTERTGLGMCHISYEPIQ